MATVTTSRPVHATTPSTALERRGDNPAYQAFWLLRIGFTAAPILFGLDKFAHVLVNWDRYLAPWIDRMVPGTAHQAMYAVGVIEVIAGLVVAVRPRFGGYLVAAWLARDWPRVKRGLAEAGGRLPSWTRRVTRFGPASIAAGPGSATRPSCGA